MSRLLERVPLRMRRPRQAETGAALMGAGLLTLLAVACGSEDNSAPPPIPATSTVAVAQAATPAAQESVQPDASVTAASAAITEPFEGPPTLFELPRAGGGQVSLGALIGTQPVVVVFYRGFF